MKNRQIERVLVFAGGTGSNDLIRYLAIELGVKVSVVVNGYDDGKSTGVLREIIPGLLGPSDFRKNISNLVSSDTAVGRASKQLLDFRFPQTVTKTRLIRDLDQICANPLSENFYGLHRAFSALTDTNRQKIVSAVSTCVSYCKKSSMDSVGFQDMALGNMIIAGLYLDHDHNFNVAIDKMHMLFPVEGQVLNVSKGENLVLVGLRKDAFVAEFEYLIANDRSGQPYTRIYLLENQLSIEEKIKLKELADIEKIGAELHRRHVSPKLNPVVQEQLLNADIVVMGPGTQYSSLFPTYLTEKLGEVLRNDVVAPKVLITNISEDSDIARQTARMLLEKATEHLCADNDLFSHCLVNQVGEEETDQKLVVPGSFADIKTVQVRISQWWNPLSAGKHHSGRVIAELAKILSETGKYHSPFGFRSLSIIIPAFNERASVASLLDKIKRLDFSSLKVFTEILFIDDGSTDGTVDCVREFDGIRLFIKEENEGKGSAVKIGLKESYGDFVVIQDADLEYQPNEIFGLLEPCMKQQLGAVYGSRTLNTGATRRALKLVYPKHPKQYWISFIGGYVLSLWIFILYGRLLTDTLTGYKLFDGSLIRGLTLESKGFELDHEITTKILRKKKDILEVPITYSPRTRVEGKKIKNTDGVKALWTILKYRFGRLD